MITYQSSDIIKRALQLADLENSDFLSFSEKIALLNEAYQTIYQKSINKDSNAFVRYINTSSKVINLPCDFYQLKAVTLNRGGYIRQVLRRPANGSLNDLSYDMINNVIQINGDVTGADICIEYFPQPSSLTFPNKDYLLDGLEDVLDANGDFYLVKGADNDSVVLRSFSDSSVNEDISITGVNQYLIHMEQDFISFTNGTHSYIFDLNTFVLSEDLGNENPIVFWNNRTYLSSPVYELLDPEVLTGYIIRTPILNTDGTIAVNVKADIMKSVTKNIEGMSFVMLSNDMSKFIGFTNSNVYVNQNVTPLPPNTYKKMFYYRDLVYLVTPYSNFLTVYNFADDSWNNSTEKTAVVDIVKVDENTGYGLLGLKRGRYFMTSFFDDTVLNFPNNTYFVFMSYLLALSFKSKQGSDITELAVLAEQAENTFYDTLGRDDWNSTRITNAY